MTLAVRASLQDAFLLHRKPYRETSALLDMLTREHGQIRLIGKGVSRGRGLQASLLRPFCPLSVSWAGRSGLPALADVEATGPVFALSGKALFCGFYVNELVLRLLPSHDAYPGIFTLYERVMERLQNTEGLEYSLRHFELALLDELGYGPDLLHEADSGEPVDPEAAYAYENDVGVRRVPRSASTISGTTLIGLRTGCPMEVGMLTEAKRLMRGIIQHRLGGRPLKSRELFKFSPTA